MKFNKILYLLFAGASTLAACKKSFLDEQPSTAVTVQTSINTTNDLADAVNGMYNVMKATTLFGRDIPVLGDLLADNTYVNVSNSGRYLLENNYQFIPTTAEPGNIYGRAYYSILQANRIIYEGKKLATSADNNQLMGEAYASRGLLYLELVTWFGSPYTVNPNASAVPVVTTPSYITGFDIKLPRATVNAVYNQIISDLDSAYTLMPEAGTTYHAINSDYIAKYAAKAIESRAYLYKGDYANALTAAKLVVDKGGYSLATTAATFTGYWANPAAQTGKLETVFELNQNASSNLGNTGLDAIFSQSGYGDIQATDNLYNAYTSTDLRRTLIINGTRGGQQAWIINKFPNYTNTDKDETKIIRYAEVVLTLAESYARTGDETSAKNYLNQLAILRDPSFKGYTSSGAQLITDILNERRKELAFEGLRFFDLTRLNLDFTRPAQAYGYVSYPTVLKTDYHRILPIPQSARDANPNLTQNPGYTPQ
ncbi:RagB/SusD family nutrient uptake outer membrane protein [Mucilaginibacter robiniae]|uniref:RagB/SusD family nutrient uptake outer membrane protein n=1 Tax=Mucilaginibacter robiniae TaxID=2728022 RepID=A0A7L5DWC3_9SPHI|nr:RagB/SusD family nutrient uptake outer membrane protein [Mucilaginibacter robiniae]QJD95385.1 RagB/SusD family nutrient uptake outer membrane protein [Mucilaginibacter robiniae]